MSVLKVNERKAVPEEPVSEQWRNRHRAMLNCDGAAKALKLRLKAGNPDSASPWL